MPGVAYTSSGDFTTLKNIITGQTHELKAQQELIAIHEAEIKRLNELTRYLKSELYDRRSEKRSVGETREGLLFNEAETYAAGKPDEKTAVKKHSRKKKKKAGRKALSESIPRVEVVHDLPDEEKQGRNPMGADIHEVLVYIPEQIYVERNIYHKYALPEGVEIEGEPAVKTAVRVKRMIDKGIASASVLAATLTAKFCDHLPFYRLEKIYARRGVTLSRQTMCNWQVHVARRCEPLLRLMWDHIRSSPVIWADETRLQVMKEEGRKDTQQSYMWLIRGGPPDKPGVIFEYRRTRGASFLEERLKGSMGVLITDGYRAYERVARALQLVHAGCWDHARRKFVDLLKSVPGSPAGKSALKLIGRLYALESEAREDNLSDETLLALRRKYSARRLRWFKRWLDRLSVQTLKKDSLGKAVRYAINQWDKLTVFLDNALIPISNILAENSVRPFVIGRKNWMFSGSPRGAAASATIYSLIETAKANGLEPYWYLRYLFEKLPYATTDDEFTALLPFHLSMDVICDSFPEAPRALIPANSDRGPVGVVG